MASSTSVLTMDTRSLPLFAAGEIAVPRLIGCWDEVIERDTRFEEHSHPTHELLWNERGASTATVGARIWTVTTSVGLWIPAGLIHTGWLPAGTRMRAAQFRLGEAPAIATVPVAVDITPILRLLLDRLDLAGLSDASRATTEAMVLDVLTPTDQELLVRIPQSELVAPIVRVVRDRPGDGTTLEQWAHRLSVSTRTITRVFHAETGLSFSRWVSSVRTQHAMSMLGRGDEIQDIAEAVGFRSVSAFGAAFRRATGVSPGRFRAE